MDSSGWAVIIGAVVAFAGATFSPWLLAKIDRSKREAKEQREAIRKALVDVTRGLTRMHRYRLDPDNNESAFEETMMALTDLGLAVNAADAQVEHLATITLTIVQTGSLEDRGRGLGAWQTATHQWYRGEIPASEIIAVAKAEAAKDPGPTLRQ